MVARLITQKRLKEVLNYDHENGIFTWAIYKKCVAKGDVAGTIRPTTGYLSIGIDYKVYSAHRLAWLYVYGYLPIKPLDHIDRCKTNNSINNLRECSHSENSLNMDKSKRNTTGYLGVSYRPERDKFHSQLCVGGKRLHLGYYDTAKKASEAYLKAKKLHV
jgi:hypothetical protein